MLYCLYIPKFFKPISKFFNFTQLGKKVFSCLIFSNDRHNFSPLYGGDRILLSESGITQSTHSPREMDTREARISASTELNFY